MRIRSLFAVAAIMLASAPLSQAATINGSLPFAGFGLTQNGADLSVSTQITAGVYSTTNFGVGDYSAVALGSAFNSGGTPSTVTLNLNNLSTFTFTNPTYGTFVANGPVGGSGSQVIVQNSNFLSVYLLGTFTPAVGAPSPLGGLSPTQTSLRLSFNFSGGSLSGSASMSSPAEIVPEPSTYALGTLAAGAMAFIARRRKSVAK